MKDFVSSLLMGDVSSQIHEGSCLFPFDAICFRSWAAQVSDFLEITARVGQDLSDKVVSLVNAEDLLLKVSFAFELTPAAGLRTHSSSSFTSV